MFMLPWEDLTLTVLLLCFEKGDIEVLTLLRLFLGRHFATLGLKDCFASRERGLQDAWPLIVRCEIREGAKSDAKTSKQKVLLAFGSCSILSFIPTICTQIILANDIVGSTSTGYGKLSHKSAS
jgi:hypothetical protein